MNNRVLAPAIALLVTAFANVALAVFGLLFPTDTADVEKVFRELDIPSDSADRAIDIMQAIEGPVQLVGIALGLLIGIGAVRMIQRKSWGLALTASIAALIPCFGCCCVGIPAGIWSLITLFNPQVKAAFGKAPPAAPDQPFAPL